MRKWYEVVLQATKVIVVEVEDTEDNDPEDEAWEVAKDESGFGFCDLVESIEITELTTADQIERCKRYADEVVPFCSDRIYSEV
jgi:hypothetical protein